MIERQYFAAELVPDVIVLAHAAAQQILIIYETEFTIEHKDDQSPLTDADLAAHDIIVAGLSKLTPEIPVLSEESGEIPFEVRATWSRYWLVDPLDGTREFIKRNGEFTVNIALIESGEPVLGVIVVPLSGLAYSAVRGGGAFKQAVDGEPSPIRTRMFEDDSVVVASSRSYGSEALQGFLARLGQYRHVPLGSSLKSCMVAEGLADIYPRFGLTSEWDTAAAQCIVEQAGGLLLDLTLQPLRYNTKASLLNPPFIVVGDGSHDWASLLV